MKLITPGGWSNISPVGTIFVPSPPKTGTNLLHPRPSPIVEQVGHAIAYRWRSLPRVHRHGASKPQGGSERVLPWQVTMDQLIFASLSHTHYWYEVYRSTNTSKTELRRSYPPSPTKPRSVHRRVPADQAIPTQHPGAVVTVVSNETLNVALFTLFAGTLTSLSCLYHYKIVSFSEFLQ